MDVVDRQRPRHRRHDEEPLSSTRTTTATTTPTTKDTNPNASGPSTAASPSVSQGASKNSNVSTSATASLSWTLATANENTHEAFITTLIPVTTVTHPTTTYTSYVESLAPSPSFSGSPSTSTSTSTPIFTSPIAQGDVGTLVQTCAGRGLDAAADGVLTALIIPGLAGLGIWFVFAMLRPRFPQVYALREWFVQESLRPAPLGSGFFAWLFPPVPLRPDVPEDVSDAGRTAAKDSKLFPSDEQLTQRALFVALLIAVGWSVLALGGALPLYLIGTPCNGELPPPAKHIGGYSTLLDLSLLRLLRIYDENKEISILDGDLLAARALEDDEYKSRLRIIILTAIAIVLGVIPALWKLLREFNLLVEYRKRWMAVKCDNQDLGWLSASKARGFANWGEKEFKDYLVRIGLSSQLGEAGAKRRATVRRSGRARRREEEQPLNEVPSPEVDIFTLFSITDTEALAVKIFQRDEILDNLEIAEAKYISSFHVTTPDPSVIDYVPTAAPEPAPIPRPYISRPLPLTPQHQHRRSIGPPRRAVNRAYGASSFVAPSSFYRLRGLRGVSGGRFTDSGLDLSGSIHSRPVGSRFMEMHRNSVAYGRLPLGAHVGFEREGELGPVSETGSWLPPIPDPRYYGPNYHPSTEHVDELGVRHHYDGYDGGIPTVHEAEEEWVDLAKETPANDWGVAVNGTPPSTGPVRRPRPPPKDYVPSSRRETFPLRPRDPATDPQSIPPPHLRLQHSTPYVLPREGVNLDDLGEVYADINRWRVELKNINNEIAMDQQLKYQDIAAGERVKGWLMTGKNLRFIPGIELIEGRAKEDIRWDVLQDERSWLDGAVLWAIILVVMALLAAGLTAAAGLSLTLAPDFAHYLSFLSAIFNTHPVVAGIVTVFAPAVIATTFIALGMWLINGSAKIHGSVSISGNQLLVFRLTFFALTFVGTVWLVCIGALLYAIEALDTAQGEVKALANGSIYMSVLALALIINVAIIVPACLLLQPFRLWRVLRAEKDSLTPRQRFRATFPRTYNPSYAMGACILAIVFASTFALIFPLIAPAVVVFLLLTLVAHRYLVGYVYVRTHSQTGGLLQIWTLKRFGTLLSFQPILLGLIFLSRRIWIEGAVLVVTGLFVIVFVEIYCNIKLRQPGVRSLNPATQNSLELFIGGADTYLNHEKRATPMDMSETSNGNTTLLDLRDPANELRGYTVRNRGSFASVLDIMSQTVKVVPATAYRGAVPLETENLNDLTATERAARTHRDAPPRLPPLAFTEHADEMGGILYAPELIAPPPIIWLPNDSAGVAQSEATDLQKYHNLLVTLDVRSHDDVLRRSSSSRRQPT